MKTTKKLSTLWIIVVMNIIIADILSVFIELELKNTLEIFGEVKTTMAIAAFILNIPILMIYFSRSLSFKLNRILNILAGFITILFVVGGGGLTPHYIICTAIEVIVLIVIIRTSWNWSVNENSIKK
jgi:DMSO/TMAO reductase YedYZ heme-binding membrane subunit